MRKDFVDMTLPELADARETVEAYIILAVRQARRGGSTWAAIGSSLGVSMQEAHRRYRWHDTKLTDTPED
jgi:hypothetical protein